MDKQKDKFAPENSVELDHWHVPQDLEIDESSYFEDTQQNPST